VRIRSLNEIHREPLRDRGEVIPLVDPSTGSRRVDVHVNILRGGSPRGPYHFHPESENIYIILAGSGRFVADGEEYVLRKDDVVFIPPGVRHSLSAAEEGLSLIEIFAPAPVETVFVD
jgi:quercetin dioxygenase-like cupin family protein